MGKGKIMGRIFRTGLVLALVASMFGGLIQATTLLPPPSLSSPVNGATGVSTTPTFSWSSVSGATHYWLAVATSDSALPTDPNSATCSGCVISKTSLTSTSYTHTAPLAERTTYYWVVQAYKWDSTAGTVAQQGQFSTHYNFKTKSYSCWSTDALSKAQLADLVVRHFPDGIVSQTGENIRVTAYAVAKAESGGNPSACGDNNQSVGIWQVHMPSHPQYSRECLFDPDCNAEATKKISNNGQDWNAWCTWEKSACNGNGNERYKAYLDEARIALGISPTPGHDMAVTDVYTSPSSPNVGQSTTIYVTVKNEGNQQENSVPVKTYVNGAQVGSIQYVSLSADQSTTKSFAWTPSTEGTYSVKGEVGVVSGETDTSDNSKTINLVVIFSTTDLGTKAADLAKQVVGAPYLWGGKGFDWKEEKFVDSTKVIGGYHWNSSNHSEIGKGVDCSGLVFWAFNKAAGATQFSNPSNPIVGGLIVVEGKNYYGEGAAGEWAQVEHLGTKVPTVSELKPGYLLFLDTDKDGKADHVMMYVGDGYVIHAEGVKYN